MNKALTASWWKLIREDKDEDLFECRKCQQEFIVPINGTPLPEECPSCSGQMVTIPAFLTTKKGKAMNSPKNPFIELAELREARKKAELVKDSKELKKHKKDSLLFVGHVYQFITWLDAEMKKPSDQERGKRIAHALNALEMSADRFSHFTLDQSFPSIAKLKGKKS